MLRLCRLDAQVSALILERRRLAGRNTELKYRSPARRAAHGHGSAVRVRDRLGQRQAEPESAGVPVPVVVHPGDAAEDPPDVARGYARTRVTHSEYHHVVCA